MAVIYYSSNFEPFRHRDSLFTLRTKLDVQATAEETGEVWKKPSRNTPKALKQVTQGAADKKAQAEAFMERQQRRKDAKMTKEDVSERAQRMFASLPTPSPDPLLDYFSPEQIARLANNLQPGMIVLDDIRERGARLAMLHRPNRLSLIVPDFTTGVSGNETKTEPDNGGD